MNRKLLSNANYVLKTSGFWAALPHYRVLAYHVMRDHGISHQRASWVWPSIDSLQRSRAAMLRYRNLGAE